MDELKVTDYVLAGIGIWLALLSFLLFRAISHYRKLGKSENIQDLGKILEGIVTRLDLQAESLSKLSKQLTVQQNAALGHFTKHALVRFNPFEESGGDQSFIVALLDSNNNGIVLSSLHSRSGTSQ